MIDINVKNTIDDLITTIEDKIDSIEDLIKMHIFNNNLV